MGKRKQKAYTSNHHNSSLTMQPAQLNATELNTVQRHVRNTNGIQHVVMVLDRCGNTNNNNATTFYMY